MSTRFGCLGLLLLALTGCRFNIDWGSHASYRSTGKELRLAEIDPDEAVQGVISANLHYVTVALDSLFVRNLPGLHGRNVALGVEITGVLPGGKAIQTVLDVKQGAGEHDFMHFDNVALVEPFLYTGQNLTITLHFRAVGASERRNLEGRLAAAADMVRKIDPTRYQALETGIDLFKSTIASSSSSGQALWKYQITLHPADSVYRDKPEMLLTAARHILLFTPPSDAPAEARSVQTDKLVPYLRLRGNRLIWRHNEQEYTATPYLVLNVTRYRRYPKEDTELRRVVRHVDEAVEQGNLERARSLLTDLGVAISADRVITAQEKNLERARREVTANRIAALAARRRRDYGAEARQLAREIRLLTHIRTQLPRILYPYEIKNLDYRVSQLVLRAEILAKDHGVQAAPALARAQAYRAAALAAARFLPTPKRKRTSAAVVDLAKLPPPPVLPEWKHLHQKWWFWTLVTVGVAGIGAATYAVTAPAPSRTETNPPPGPSLTIPFPSAGATR